MVNAYIIEQLEGVRQGLMAAHAGTKNAASARKGALRAEVVSQYLSTSLPTAYRIGTSAQITDQQGERTGELDIVLENGFAPGFPLHAAESGRLYVAEGVGCVVEVKSNIQGQWDQALSTARRVKSLRRKFSSGSFGRDGGTTIFQSGAVFGNIGHALGQYEDPTYDAMSTRLPMFVIGFEGWSDIKSMQSKLADAGGLIDGILQIDTGNFVTNDLFDSVKASGAAGLYCLLASMNNSFTYIKGASFDWLSYVS